MPVIDQVPYRMLESQQKGQTGTLDLQVHSPVEDINKSQTVAKSIPSYKLY